MAPDRSKESPTTLRWARDSELTQSCFCQAHRLWEKGTDENANGLLREFFPKGTDFSKASNGKVERVCGPLDDGPRKALG